ncbi:DUF6714 family protein [Polaromonas aquatica]|uniref:DUF6714 family protein n=1 Tax=Polaromonas aquatica TaxID=332657 RepID=UPI003D655C61
MGEESLHPIAAEALVAFAPDTRGVPPLSLRGGNALDDYQAPPAFDCVADKLTDEYLENYHWGIAYLDPASFRHYLPHLIEYALRRTEAGSNVVDALLNGLRPPDREPPRLASFSSGQEVVIVKFLDALAFSDGSAHTELASQVLEEWWAPGALYRPAANDA